jgi:hypothetical protein
MPWPLKASFMANAMSRPRIVSKITEKTVKTSVIRVADQNSELLSWSM